VLCGSDLRARTQAGNSQQAELNETGGCTLKQRSKAIFLKSPRSRSTDSQSRYINFVPAHNRSARKQQQWVAVDAGEVRKVGRWGGSLSRRPHTREGIVSTDERPATREGLVPLQEKRDMREARNMPERPATREGFLTLQERPSSSMSDTPPQEPGIGSPRNSRSQRMTIAIGQAQQPRTSVIAPLPAPKFSILGSPSGGGLHLPAVQDDSLGAPFRRQTTPMEGDSNGSPVSSATMRGFRARPSVQSARRSRIGQDPAPQRHGVIGEEEQISDGNQKEIVRTITDAQGFEIKQVVQKDTRSTSFEAALGLAKKHGIPLNDIRVTLQEYRSLDVDGSDSLTMEEFEGAIRKRCNLQPDEPVPESLVVATHQQADSDGDGTVCFEEFLLWSRQCNFVEEMAVTSPEDRHVRKLAREHGLTLIHVEQLMVEFRKFDLDGSGFIEWEEFLKVLCNLLEVKEATDISEAKVRRYWTEADADSAGRLSFSDFVKWYGAKFFERQEGYSGGNSMYIPSTPKTQKRPSSINANYGN